MTTHLRAAPEQLPLPFPRPRDLERARTPRDEVVLLLAQLLLSAARHRPLGQEPADEPR